MPGVLCSDPDWPCEMVQRQRARIFAVYGQQERTYRDRPPSRWSGSVDGSSFQGSSRHSRSVFTRTVEPNDSEVNSEWDTCVSRTNDELSSCDYPPSRRSAPYLPKAFSKSSQMMPPARDYRWNLIRNRSTPVAPVAPVPPAPPVTGNLPLKNSPGLQVRPPTMRRDYSQDGPLDAHHSTAFVGGRCVAQFP